MRLTELKDTSETTNQDITIPEALYALPIEIYGITKPSIFQFVFEMAAVRVDGNRLGNITIEHQPKARCDSLLSSSVTIKGILPIFAMSSRAAVTESIQAATLRLQEDSGFGNTTILLDSTIVVNGSVIGVNLETGELLDSVYIDRFEL